MFVCYAVYAVYGADFDANDGVGFLRVRSTKGAAIDAVLRDLYDALAEIEGYEGDCPTSADVVAMLGSLPQSGFSFCGTWFGHAVHVQAAE